MSHILLNLTDNCNLKCKYCFTHQHPRDMTLDIAKKAVLWLWENKDPFKEQIHVTFFGGEPMLKFEEIINIPQITTISPPQAYSYINISPHPQRDPRRPYPDPRDLSWKSKEEVSSCEMPRSSRKRT